MKLSPAGSCLRAPVVLALAIATVFPAVSAVAQSGFSDLGEAGSHQTDVENLEGKGVLEGTECRPGAFCPTDPLERWVMAVWLVRVLDGTDPPPSSTRFVDVDANAWWTPYVERLAVLGVTVGCATGPARFCPDDSVTRAQMATFLTRAFDLDAASSFGFVDIGGTHADSINALAGAGVTVGCATGPARFCPDDSVTRAQMATFLTRAIRRTDLSTDLESASGRVVAGSFQVIVTFARDVTGFTADDVVVANGRVSGITGAGGGYEVTIAPAVAGTVVVRIHPGAAVDAAGNMSRGSEPLVRTFGWDGRSAPGLDTWDRDAVVRSYRMEFDREEPNHGFTGDVDECDAGTTSQAFRDSVVQRVNWYRRMAGVLAVTERAEFSVAAQHAALMMSAEGNLSHYPNSDWKCYSDSGALGARSSNLGLGRSGVSGINSYMRDPGSGNLAVGHRRWILTPQLRGIGVGNVPYSPPYSYLRANALYVLGLGGRDDVREPRGFIAWPPSGYIPAETVWGRWSFQLPRADFREATVTVMDNDGPVPTQVIDRTSFYGTAAVVWAVRGDTISAQSSPPSDGDECYTVTISEVRINGEIQVPFQYATCLVDAGR